MGWQAWSLIGYMVVQIPLQFAGKPRHELTPAWAAGLVAEVGVMVWFVTMVAK